jgi:hypothetical protein
MMRTLEPKPHRRASLAFGGPLFGAATLLVVLALTGCGTSDSGGGAAISPKEFSAQINSTCKAHIVRLKALASREEKRRGIELSMRRYAEVFQGQGRITQELIADLEQLKPPESVAGEWDRYLDALDDVSTYTAKAGADIASALSGGKPDMEELGRLEAGAEELSEATVSYDEAVQDLNRAGVMSKCLSEAIGDFEVGQKEPSPTPSGQQPAEPNPQGPK